MKRILTTLLFAFCVLTIYSSNVESANIIYMNETFKDDTAGQPPANWTSNGQFTTFQVSNTPTKCDGQCLHLVDGSGGSQAEYTSQMWDNVSTDVRQFNISFMVNFTTFSQNNFNVLNTACYRIDFRNKTTPFGVQIFNKSESAFTPSGFNGIESRGYEVDILIDRDTNLSHTRVNDGATTVSADGTIDGTCDIFSTFVGSIEGTTSGASDYYLDNIVVFSEVGEVNSTENVTSPLSNLWYPSSPINLSFDSNTTFNVTYNLNAGNNVTFCTNCNNKTGVNELSTNEGKNNITIYFEDGSTTTELFREYYIGLSIALCTDPILNTPSANYTFRLETNDTVVNATSNGLWESTLNITSAFSSGFAESDSIQLCTHPNATSMTSSTLIDYEQTDFVSRQFNGFQILTNLTQFFTLYMLESASSEAIVITVQDSDANLLSQRVVEAHRFFVANNTFKLVDSGLTDVNGITELDLDSGSNIEYKFIVKNGNTIELETGRITLTTNTLTLTVLTGLEKTLETLNKLRDNVISTLSFDEDDSIVTLTFTDNENIISTGCLNLFNKTSQHQVLLGGNCSNDDTATLTLAVPLINISYIAYFDAVAIEDGNNYTLNSLDIDLNKDFEIWGTFGLFLAFLFFLMLMGIIEDPIGKVIMGMFAFGFFKLSEIIAIKTTVFWGIEFILIWGVFLMYKRKRGS